jgi:hypothetical protein
MWLFASRTPVRDTHSGAEGCLCDACQPGSAGLGGASTTPLSGRNVVFDFPGGYPG